MDKQLQPLTFNNVDFEKKRVIITPRGPDPVLFGIRGETADVVKRAFGMVKSLEPVERCVIFRSNQGTDSHLRAVQKLSDIQQYDSVIAKGVVSQNPRIVPLRHVIFSIKDATAEVDCAAYEPTGDLRKIARELSVGDSIEVYGAAHRAKKDRRLTVNLEKIHILNVALKTLSVNPLCPYCGKRLKSMGKGQGFRCEKCRRKFRDLRKVVVTFPRSMKPGLYVTSPGSQRHLTKPIRRYGLEKADASSVLLISDWHQP